MGSRHRSFTRTSEGSRYSDLVSAYSYRKNLSYGCSCDGRSPAGTAPVSIATDVTLRPGDAVVTTNGVKIYLGGGHGPSNARNYSRVEGFNRLPAEERNVLSRVEVTREAPLVLRELQLKTKIVIHPRIDPHEPGR